jgi:hypothetical protein
MDVCVVCRTVRTKGTKSGQSGQRSTKYTEQKKKNPAGWHRCLSVVGVVCYQVEVSATGRSLVQRSSTDCGVCVTVCDVQTSKNEAALAHVGFLCQKIIIIIIIIIITISQTLP